MDSNTCFIHGYVFYYSMSFGRFYVAVVHLHLDFYEWLKHTQINNYLATQVKLVGIPDTNALAIGFVHQFVLRDLFHIFTSVRPSRDFSWSSGEVVLWGDLALIFGELYCSLKGLFIKVRSFLRKLL